MKEQQKTISEAPPSCPRQSGHKEPHRSAFVIDASVLVNPRTGIGVYVYELLKALSQIDQTNAYTLYFHRSRSARNRKQIEQLLCDPLAKNFRLWIRHPLLPKNLKVYRYSLGKVDCFHATGFFIYPPFLGDKSIVTIHDLIYEVFPHWYGKNSLCRFRSLGLSSARRARCIIVHSNHTKQDLVHYWNIPPEKIEVIPLGVASVFFEEASPEQISNFRQRFRLGKKYFLFVGALNQRKNIGTLLKAFETFHAKHPASMLVLCGPKDPANLQIFDRIAELPCRSQVRYLGYLPDEDMPLLYKAANLFLFPSLYEGYGLPVLEAMASGCPVVCSNVSSLPEVAGNAAILVDPNDADGLAQAMLEVTEDPSLREALVAKGRAHASHYPWEEVARKTLSVYQRVAQESD